MNEERENPRRLVAFEKPEAMPRDLDQPEVVKIKHDFLDYLWAGYSELDAAKVATGDKPANAMRKINLYRKTDQQFDQKVKNIAQLQREARLPELEENMFRQATQDSVAAGNLALRLAERLAPDVWGKPEKRTKKEEPSEPADYGFNEWMAVPKPIDANYREVDGEDE